MSEHLGAALERAGQLFGAREAVVDGDLRWTYKELSARVAGFDASLDELGLADGDVVAVLAQNSAAHLVMWLAVPRSGRVLNDLNVRLAPAELEFILRDCRARMLVVDDAYAEIGRSLADACETVRYLVHDGGETVEGTLSFTELSTREGGPSRAPAPEALAGIFYTGGTTGLPKGAMLTHRNLVANAKHALVTFGLGEDDSHLHAAPMFHLADGSVNYALTWIGGRHVIIPAFTPRGWAAMVEAEKVTRGLLVPTMIAMVLNDEAAMAYDLGSLRGMLYGASPMPEALLRRAMDVFRCGWGQAYGMTEAAPIVSYLSPADHRRALAGSDGDAGLLRSAGRPIVGVEAEVRRADGTRAEEDEIGEIWVRGPNIMLGYWNRPEETAAALDDDGWYHSGDAGRVDAAGYLFVVDRVKDMIISGGENVYSTEVENALAQHPEVVECAVFGVPDDRWGERVHAAVVLTDEASTTADDLIQHCRTLIAGYKLPRSIDLHAEPLPKSGAGKLLKRELRAPYWDGHERQIS
jgi:long-chain acyl-CoA synthetase